MNFDKDFIRFTSILFILLTASIDAKDTKLGPADNELTMWQREQETESDFDCVNDYSSGPEILPCDNFSTELQYFLPVVGGFRFNAGDSLGVWFRPSYYCFLKKIQILVHESSGLLDRELLVSVFDIPDTLFPENETQELTPGNGTYDFSRINRLVPSPQGTLLGQYPLTVTKTGFDLENGWSEINLSDFNGPIEMGTRDFFISFRFPEGNDDSADVYYGPSNVMEWWDWHGFKYYPDGGTFSPGVGNWVSRYNFSLRAIVEYMDIVPRNIEISEVETIHLSTDTVPYPIYIVLPDSVCTNENLSIESVSLIVFNGSGVYPYDYSVIDSQNVVGTEENCTFTAYLPRLSPGTTVQYIAEVKWCNNVYGQSGISRSHRYFVTYIDYLPEASILMVLDGSDKYSSLLQTVLIEQGYLYEKWDVVSLGLPSLDVLNHYSTVFWLSPKNSVCRLAGAADLSLIKPYLDGGGNLLLISPQYLGLVENDFSGQWSIPTHSFVKNYLKVAEYCSYGNWGESLGSDSLYTGIGGNIITDFIADDTLHLDPAYYSPGEFNPGDEVMPSSEAAMLFKTFNAQRQQWEGAGILVEDNYRVIFIPWDLPFIAESGILDSLIGRFLLFFFGHYLPVPDVLMGPRYGVARGSGPYEIIVVANDLDGTVQRVELGISDNGRDFIYSDMIRSNGNIYTGECPSLSAGEQCFYRIRAQDDTGLNGYSQMYQYKAVDFQPQNRLLYCGDNAYLSSVGDIDTVITRQLDKLQVGYDIWDVDRWGLPSWVSVLDHYSAVIWNRFANTNSTFPQNSIDNPLTLFIQKGGNLLISLERIGEYPGAVFDTGNVYYDLFGIAASKSYNYRYLKVQYTNNPLSENFDREFDLSDLPWSYYTWLIEPTDAVRSRRINIFDAWINNFDNWASKQPDHNYSVGWIDSGNSTKVLLPFPMVAMDEKNLSVLLENVLDQFNIESSTASSPFDLPLRFTLNPNYPNPFNVATQIRYELPEKTDVKMSIFNINGQEVARLISESQNAGYYHVQWDASCCSSGIYLIYLSNGNSTEIQKCVLLK